MRKNCWMSLAKGFSRSCIEGNTATWIWPKHTHSKASFEIRCRFQKAQQIHIHNLLFLSLQSIFLIVSTWSWKHFAQKSAYHKHVHFFRTKKNSKNQQQPCLLNLCSSSLLYHYYILYMFYLPKCPRNVKISQSRRTRRCWITEGTLLCSFRTFERLAESGTSSHMSGPWADGYFHGRKYIDYTGVMTCNNAL